MEIAKIEVNGGFANAIERRLIPSGLVGGTISVDYTDSIWDGLMKTVVFQGAVTRDVIDDDSVITIPHETVATAGVKLQVGFYGVDAAGMLVIPTVWVDLGTVNEGVEPSGDPSTAPDLPVWAQIQSEVEELRKTCIGGGIAVSGAQAGQTVKISAVDEKGVPTAWSTVDFPVPGWKAALQGAVITATGDSTVSATTVESTVGGYVRIIANLFDMEYENVAVGGATVASGIVDGDGNTRFSVCSSISAMRTDADIILLSGGVNDQAMISKGYEEIGELTPDFKSVINPNTLYGGLEYLLRQAIYKWSNKTILFVIPHRMTNTMDYRTAIHAACKKYSIPVVDITETTPDFYLLDGFSEQYTANADGWHANEDGHNTFYVPRILAAVMENFRGRGETITLVDNNLESLIQGSGGEDTFPDPATYYPETAGFIRSNGTISTSTNYKRTDYLLLDGFEEAEYLSFVIKDTAMATWALFDADKKWLYSSEDVNGTEYYTTIQNGAKVSYGLLKKVLSITELKQSYPTAKYIVLSTCNQANLHETVLNQNGEDVGWGSTPQYITLW